MKHAPDERGAHATQGKWTLKKDEMMRDERGGKQKIHAKHPRPTERWMCPKCAHELRWDGHEAEENGCWRKMKWWGMRGEEEKKSLGIHVKYLSPTEMWMCSKSLHKHRWDVHETGENGCCRKMNADGTRGKDEKKFKDSRTFTLTSRDIRDEMHVIWKQWRDKALREEMGRRTENFMEC